MLEVFRSDLLLHLPGSSKRMAGGIRLIEGMENAAAMHESSAPFGWIYSPAVTETAGFFYFSRLQAPAAVSAG